MEKHLNVVVSNRSKSESFRPDTTERWAAISIFTPGDSPAELVGFVKVIHLCFDDVCSSMPNTTRFTPQMAEQTWAFVDEILDADIPNLLVHCDAGMSRSPGMAIAIDEIVNGSTTRAAQHPYYNSLVYRSMVNEKNKGKVSGFTFIEDHLKS